MYTFRADVTRRGDAPEASTWTLHAPLLETTQPAVQYACRIDSSSFGGASTVRGSTPLDALANAIAFIKIVLEGGLEGANRVEWT